MVRANDCESRFDSQENDSCPPIGSRPPIGSTVKKTTPVPLSAADILFGALGKKTHYPLMTQT